MELFDRRMARGATRDDIGELMAGGELLRSGHFLLCLSRVRKGNEVPTVIAQ